MPTVIVNSPFIPPEWLTAHGFTVQAVTPVPQPDAKFGEGRCALAEALRMAVADAPAAVLVWASPCDQLRRAGDELPESPSRFRFHVPVTWQGEAPFRYYAAELRRLGRFLVAHGGREPDDATLAHELAAWDRRRQQLRELRKLLPDKEFTSRLLGWPGEAAPPSQGGAGVPPAKDRATTKNPIPLALLGSALTESDLEWFDGLARAGGTVVLNVTENGETILPEPVDRRGLAEHPFTAMAQAHFHLPAGFRRPNDALYAFLAKELPARGVRGLIVRRQLWCDLWHAEVARLREATDLPLLDLEAVAGTAPAHTRTRIEAFMEALRMAKPDRHYLRKPLIYDTPLNDGQDIDVELQEEILRSLDQKATE